LKYLSFFKINGLVILSVLFVFLSVNCLSAKEYPSFFRGVRPLGMGGAFTAVSDDENALFYNPAGLSKISTVQIGVFNPLIEVSEDSIDLFNDAQDTNFDNTGETTDLMRKYIGEHQHARVLFPVSPYVGFNVSDVGVMISGGGQGTMDVEVRNPTWPEAHVNLLGDAWLIGGAGAKLPLNGLSVGGSLKYVYRESLNEVYTAAEIAADDFEDRLKDDSKTGNGITMDIGAIYRLPLESDFKTDVGLSIQNLFEMDMGDAEDIKRSVNLGVAVERSFGGFKAIGAFDIMDITRNFEEDDDYMKRIHMGAEVQFPTILALRAGFNQGYLSAGATADFWALRLDFATYGEEVGAYSGQREDRRYVGQLTFGW